MSDWRARWGQSARKLIPRLARTNSESVYIAFGCSKAHLNDITSDLRWTMNGGATLMCLDDALDFIRLIIQAVLTELEVPRLSI